MANKRRQLIPECAPALNQMKYEIAAELGIQSVTASAGFDAEFGGELGSFAGAGGRSGYLGYITSREAGLLGGNITRRLIQSTEQQAIQ